jgi:hypothetical protein
MDRARRLPQAWEYLAEAGAHNGRYARPPGRLSRRSIQFGRASAPRLPHWLHRMRGPNEGTGTSSGHASTFTARSWPQWRQVTSSPRTPFWRMLPRVIGRIGSSKRGIVGAFYPRPRRTGTGFGRRACSSACRGFRLTLRTLSDGAGGFLPGVPLDCLGTASQRWARWGVPPVVYVFAPLM